MKRTLTVPERLIIDVDSNLGRGASLNPISKWLRYRGEVLNLADGLMGTGVCFKMGPILRACGYQLIEAIHERGLRVCADLNLFDTAEALSTEGALLRPVNPEMVTVACASGVPAMRALKAELPNTEVLGVMTLPSLNVDEIGAIFGNSPETAIFKLAFLAEAAGIDGFVCGSTFVPKLRGSILREMSFNVTDVQPLWSIPPRENEDLSHIVTPEKAFRACADRIVVGSCIMRPLHGSSLVAVEMIISDIEKLIA